MQIKIFCGANNLFYLSKNSSLNHCHHPPLKSKAILRGQSNMETGDIDILTLLFSVNVTPTQISQKMEQLKGPESGTFMPKRVYDINKKTEERHDFVYGLLPDSNDAEKTLSKLERSNISHVYHLVWATKVALAAICLIFPALVLGYKSFNCSMYHVPVPTLIEKFV